MCVFASGGEIPPLLLHLFLSKVVVRRGGRRKRVEHQHHTHLHKKKGERERGNRRGFSTLSSLWTIDSNQPPPPPPLLLLLQSVRFVIHRHPSPFRETGRGGKGKRHRRHFQQLAFSFLFRTPVTVTHPHKNFFPRKINPNSSLQEESLLRPEYFLHLLSP